MKMLFKYSQEWDQTEPTPENIARFDYEYTTRRLLKWHSEFFTESQKHQPDAQVLAKCVRWIYTLQKELKDLPCP